MAKLNEAMGLGKMRVMTLSRIYAATQPRCPFDEVALITADERLVMWNGLWTDHTADRLRDRVRRLGGDAIVGLTEFTEDRGTTTTQTVSRSREADSTTSQSSAEFKTSVTPHRERRLQGIVVRFTRDDCRD